MERNRVKVQLKRTGRIIEVYEGGATHQAAVGGKGAWQLPGAAPLPKSGTQSQQRSAPAPAPAQKKSVAATAVDNTIPVPALNRLEPMRAEFGKFPTREQVQKPEEKTPDAPLEPAAKTPETAPQPKTNRKQGGKNAKG